MFDGLVADAVLAYCIRTLVRAWATSTIKRRDKEDGMDYYNDEQDYIRQEKNDLAYQRELLRHPSCQDPDHPGCVSCEPEHFIEE